MKEVSPEAITDNTFRLIGKGWMLVTAGTEASFNTMTAPWGGLGVLRDKKIGFCVIRPTRYAYAFMEKSEGFTSPFFQGTAQRCTDILRYEIRKDVNRVAETGLTHVFDKGGPYTFVGARLVTVCRKIYTQDIAPENFLDPESDKLYPKKDYHRMYVGGEEILRCLSP